MSIIAAVAENLAIGKNNALLWNIPEDMKHFRELTSGHAIVMGQRTYESIGRPLPNRTNIVVTDNPDFEAPGCEVFFSLEDALAFAREQEPEEVFIIGGGTVYRQTLPLADRLYLTVVKVSPEADTFFPNYEEFARIIHQEDKQSGGYAYSFLVLER